MKLLAFAATTHSKSINRQLVEVAVRQLTELVDDLDAEILDLNDYEMPIFSLDREQENGLPAEATKLYEKIGDVDAVLISYAEHNGYYTAAYKNTFDWMSRIDKAVYQGKPTVMLATSPGPGGARNVLQSAVGSAAFFGNDVLASLSVPSFGQNVDVESATITDPELAEQFGAAMTALAGVADA